jgi:hypothetical protein
MKKKTGKRLRHGSLAGAIFVLGVLILVVGGSFAAYTNFQSVKRVVSTGIQSDTMFGSNYLSLISLTDENPPVKRISLAESDNYYTITVIVCNYVWGDETLYNPKNITYTVRAVPMPVSSVPCRLPFRSLPYASSSLSFYVLSFSSILSCL